MSAVEHYVSVGVSINGTVFHVDMPLTDVIKAMKRQPSLAGKNVGIDIPLLEIINAMENATMRRKGIFRRSDPPVVQQPARGVTPLPVRPSVPS